MATVHSLRLSFDTPFGLLRTNGSGYALKVKITLGPFALYSATQSAQQAGQSGIGCLSEASSDARRLLG